MTRNCPTAVWEIALPPCRVRSMLLLAEGTDDYSAGCWGGPGEPELDAVGLGSGGPVEGAVDGLAAFAARGNGLFTGHAGNDLAIGVDGAALA